MHYNIGLRLLDPSHTLPIVRMRFRRHAKPYYGTSATLKRRGAGGYLERGRVPLTESF